MSGRPNPSSGRGRAEADSARVHDPQALAAGRRLAHDTDGKTRSRRGPLAGSADPSSDQDAFAERECRCLELGVGGDMTVEFVGAVSLVDPPGADAIDIVGDDQATNGEKGPGCLEVSRCTPACGRR